MRGLGESLFSLYERTVPRQTTTTSTNSQTPSDIVVEPREIPQVAVITQPISDETENDKDKKKRKRRSVKKTRQKPKKRSRQLKRPWAHNVDVSEIVGKIVVESDVDHKFGSCNFNTFAKSKTMSAHYQMDHEDITSSSEDSDNDSSHGKKTKPIYIGANEDDFIDNVYPIKKSDITRDDADAAERYGIDLKSSTESGFWLRREILIYLSTSRAPMEDFVEILAGQFSGSKREDFVWVWPHDIENLSRKEPILYGRQNYQVQDFVKELMHLFYVNSFNSGNKDISAVASAIYSFLKKLLSSGANVPTTTKKDPRFKREGGEIEKEEEVEVTGENVVNVVKEPDINDWIKLFEQLFRPDRGRMYVMTREFPEQQDVLGLLILKPEVRGMIKTAHQVINVECDKDFTVQELVFSKDTKVYFARFIALQKMIPNVLPGHTTQFPTQPSQVTNGVVNIYNQNIATRYVLGYTSNEKTHAIEYFRKVKRRWDEGSKKNILVYERPNIRNAENNNNNNTQLYPNTQEWSLDDVESI